MSWVVGWQMPGYLPEMEPFTVDSWEDALDALRSEYERAWDEGDDDEFLEGHTEFHHARPGEPFYAVGGRLVWWIASDEGSL